VTDAGLTRDDRTSPTGLFNFAQSYWRSAEHLRLQNLPVTHPSAPTTFLFCHAIELYLKAYLRSVGVTVDGLKQYLHGVKKLGEAVQKRGLTLIDEDKEALALLSEYDNIIRSRYITTGAYTRPTDEALSAICERLDASVGENLQANNIPVRRFAGVRPNAELETSSLKINFDAANPSKRFWSMESPRDEQGNAQPGVIWEYRVEVENTSSKTIRNVSVVVEHVGPMPVRPLDAKFDKTRKTACDLKPGTTELVAVLRWPVPIIQAGMLAGSSALAYGPIKVIAAGDDITPSERLFHFDYQSEPMIFDSPPPAIAIQQSLRIIVGTGAPFETRKSAGLYKTSHTFSVAVHNSHPARFVSNCKLFLNIVNETDGGRQDYWLDGPFSLNPSEQRFREVATYLEPATVSKHAGDFIQLLIPVNAGYGVGYRWPWRLPVGAYTLSLKATSLETGPVEVVCKMWVDDERKFHFEEC
jgi:hypothetical protein